jgi:uncharacterized membrane protein
LTYPLSKAAQKSPKPPFPLEVSIAEQESRALYLKRAYFGTSVHQLVAFVVGLLGLICIVAFLFLIDYAARMLRPVSLVRRVGEYGLEVIKSVYPEQSTEAQSIAASQQNLGPPKRTILHRGKSAIVVA